MPVKGKVLFVCKVDGILTGIPISSCRDYDQSDSVKPTVVLGAYMWLHCGRALSYFVGMVYIEQAVRKTLGSYRKST